MSYSTSNGNSYGTLASISKHRSFRLEQLICAGHHRAKEEFGGVRMWARAFLGNTAINCSRLPDHMQLYSLWLQLL